MTTASEDIPTAEVSVFVHFFAEVSPVLFKGGIGLFSLLVSIKHPALHKPHPLIASPQSLVRTGSSETVLSPFTGREGIQEGCLRPSSD